MKHSFLLFFLISFYICIVQTSVNSYSVSSRGAHAVETYTYTFQDKQPFNLDANYPSIESVIYDGQDITQWFLSYFLEKSQNGRLFGVYAPEIKNTFRPWTFWGANRGVVTYKVYSSMNYGIARFAENQPVTFPASGSFPILDKVLYGVPGNDIDMTAWFKNYFMQNQVGGRLVNHPINFNSIYGDPKFEFEFNFKGLMLLNFLKFHILTRE
jgi:hypothetical protein